MHCKISRYRIWGESILGAPRGRRGRVRFPVTLVVRYSLEGRTRSGMTANMSSSGVFIVTREAPPVNTRIKAMVEWPAALDGRCPLYLVVMGIVCRTSRHGMGVAIDKHEFRLRPAPAR